LICQFLVAIIGVTVGFNKTFENAAGETREGSFLQQMVVNNIENGQIRPFHYDVPMKLFVADGIPKGISQKLLTA
jgi:hypothetical protein